MSKRYGKKRVPECQCEYNFTCRPCLDAGSMRVTWFYKLRADDQGVVWFSLWTAEGDTFVQSSASMRVSFVLTDRYWDGIGGIQAS